MAPKLNWTCDECGGSSKADWVILTGIQLDKALNYNEVTGLDKDLGSWSAMCTDHAQKFPETGYFFEAKRINTRAKALDWTLHLLEKGWLQNTNWNEFLRSKLTVDVDA